MGDIAYKLGEYARELGFNIGHVLRDEARLAGQNAVRYTFPEKKAHGVKRVESDIKKLFDTERNTTQHWEGRGGVPAGYIAVKDGVGPIFLVEGMKWGRSWSAAAVAKVHEENRDPSTGRTKSIAGSNEKVGNWNVSRRNIAKRSSVRKHIANTKKKVGQMKAGWLPALNHFARMSKASTTAPPWVIAQKKQMGSYIDTVTPGGSGTLTLINNVDYWPAAKKELLEGLVTSIAKKRMNNPNTWRRLDKITERFNRSERGR